MPDIFSVDDARALLPEIQQQTAEVVAVRADLAELAAALSAGLPHPLGGVPEAKALEARLDELLGWYPRQGLQLKGFAPVLVDFPSLVGGVDVLLCWIEGEPALEWYHRVELGFMGRRRLA